MPEPFKYLFALVIVEDPIQQLLKRLLATQDTAEFEELSRELKSALHERVEKLRKEAQGLKEQSAAAERRKRPRNGKNKP